MEKQKRYLEVNLANGEILTFDLLKNTEEEIEEMIKVLREEIKKAKKNYTEGK